MEESGRTEFTDANKVRAGAEPSAEPETQNTASTETTAAADTAAEDDVRIYRMGSSIAGADGNQNEPEGQPAEGETPAGENPAGDDPAGADSANPAAAAVIQNAIVAMDELDEAKNTRKAASDALKKAQEDQENLKKKVDDTQQERIRQARDELDTSFDEKLSACQNEIRETRQKRAEAREEAVNHRILEETQPLDEENDGIQAHINELYTDNRIPKFIRCHFMAAVFFPRSAADWVMDLALGVVFIFALPLVICWYLNQNPLILAAANAAYFTAIFGIYQYVLHHYMINCRNIILEAEGCKAKIRKNLKKKNEIAAEIHKSTDDTPYNLTEFDDKVTEIESRMKGILADRREAIETFESETRDQLLQVVQVEFSEETAQAEKKLADAEKEDQDAEERLQKAKQQISDVYEPVFGKDLLNRAKLNELADYCSQNPSLTVEQAVENFRSGRK